MAEQRELSGVLSRNRKRESDKQPEFKGSATILERTRAGLAAARQRGKRLGPPIKWRPEMAKRARELMAKDGLNADDAARLLKVSRRTLFRGLQAAREHEELAGA